MITTAPSAADAVASLALRDDALPDLALILDEEQRSRALGASMKVERVRYKPGAAAVAALRAPHGDLHWLVTYSDPEKLRKSIRRAERVGAHPTRPSPSTLIGPAYADRLLVGAVERLFAAESSTFGGTRVLRYNPLRRFVLHDHAQERVLKLTAHPQTADVADMLAGRGLPVLVPERLADDVWASTWWGESDLGAPGRTNAEEELLSTIAGAVLAGIHSIPHGTVALRHLDVVGTARGAAQAVSTLLPHLGCRARALAERIGRIDGPPVLAHGDWSADQVLVHGGDVRIIDLDRATIAPPAYDLGHYCAAGGHSAMLEGYRSAGGVVDDDALRRATALALLERAIEPFRTGHPAWPARVESNVRYAERALEGAPAVTDRCVRERTA